MTYEPGWLSFAEAALEIAQQFRVSRAEAEAQLRQACADQKLRSMKAPLNERDIMPIEFWTPIAPSDWRGREVDYDGPDADGSKTEVMINEADYRYWLSHLSAKQGLIDEQPIRKAQARGKTPLIMGYLKEMFPVEKYPSGVPDPAECPRKTLKDELSHRQGGRVARPNKPPQGCRCR
jgi:hypothetical protein